jgi:hypothetical protein
MKEKTRPTRINSCFFCLSLSLSFFCLFLLSLKRVSWFGVALYLFKFSCCSCYYLLCHRVYGANKELLEILFELYEFSTVLNPAALLFME